MEDIYNYLHELKKFEIIFKEEENNPQYLRSYIKSLGEDRILIDAPTYRGKVFDIDDNQEFKMIICEEDGVHTGSCKVIERELSSTPGLWITYPYNYQRCQRREYLRAPLDADLELTLYKNSDKKETEVHNLKVRNISGKGISFITEEPLRNYYDIACRIDLKDNEPPVETTCEHIYTREVNTTRGNIYVSALAFIDISRDSSERIIKQCFKYQIEQRKKDRL